MPHGDGPARLLPHEWRLWAAALWCAGWGWALLGAPGRAIRGRLSATR